MWLIDKSHKNAEEKIREKALSLGVIDKAKVNAKKILFPLFTTLTDKKINLNFE